MRSFVIGDIHGAYKALLQCLELSKFNKEEDRLICLGDVCDRGNQIKECVDELLKIKHIVYILGNHDAWTLEWAIQGHSNEDWLEQGGDTTIASYKEAGMPKEHIRFLAKALLYFEESGRLFIHVGFDDDRGLKDTPKEMLFWDRSLLKKAKQLDRICSDWKFGDYEEVFIGHTSTQTFGKEEPQKFCNVWAMDTGAGGYGRLTIMDIDTKEFWQSDRNFSASLTSSWLHDYF